MSHRCAPKAIDVHYHIFPPAVLAGSALLNRVMTQLPSVASWTVAAALEMMDKDGVETSILSFPTPSLTAVDKFSQRSLARDCNDFYADLVQRFPTKFGLFAGLPPLVDVEGTLAEIEYAFDVLRADGVRVMTVYGDHWLGDGRFDPVWQTLDRRKAVVFVHPDMPGCCAGLPNPAAIELPFDTARTVESLWRNDVLRRYPNIRFILSHGGGALPMIAGRLLDRVTLPGDAIGEQVTAGMNAFRAFYFDTANAATPPALAATLKLAAPERILFGSDFPFVPVRRQLGYLEKSDIPDDLLDAIIAGNTRKLIGRFASRSADTLI